MKNLILIVCAFFYLFPVFIKYLPLPLDRVLQLLGLMLLFLLPKFGHAHLFTNKKVWSVMFINLAIIILTLIAKLNGPNGSDSYLFIQLLDIYFNFLSALLIIFLGLKQYGNSFSIVKIFDLIVYLFVIQAIISLIFFVSSAAFDFYLSVLNEEVNRGLFVRTNLLTKRFIGWGAAFFSGVVKYGFAFLILIVLPYCKDSAFYGKRVKYIVSLSLIALAGVMTGRFFFLAIFLGVLLAIYIDKKNFFRLIYIGVPTLIVMFLLFYSLGNYFLGPERFEIIFRFVFELFINYFDSGELTTTSSDATLSMYVFPDNIYTWLVGDGLMINKDGSYYMGSDVGYVRLIFYFGIIATLVYFVAQFLLYRVLIKNTSRGVVKKAFLFMFFWICIFHIKGLVSASEYFALFLMATVVERRLSLRNDS
ncbi:hypothetical protein [Parapedobacter lycopersici]|uniref:hypothetical protein n=1 Tax=Parapedobacter lycopersici TaxID=1864939 RepID=UPI00214DD88F|nr:hypothetical protein [Parapedobacter lycopersici]